VHGRSSLCEKLSVASEDPRNMKTIEREEQRSKILNEPMKKELGVGTEMRFEKTRILIPQVLRNANGWSGREVMGKPKN